MKNILIIDDEQIVLDVLQRILSRLGYDAVVLEKGEEAIEKYNSQMFDLVLLDVLMPEKNGFDLAREMKDINPDQKIIMVTGLGTAAAETHADMKNVLIDNVLSKPFSYEKVKEIMVETLNQ